MTQPIGTDATPATDAALLGAELKRLRLAMPTETGKPVTQAEMAAFIFVGGKGVISQFESGKRVPDEATLARYAAATGADGAELLELRRQVARIDAGRSQLPIQKSDGQEDATPPAAPSTRGRRERRWKPIGLAAVAVFLLAAGALFVGLFREPANKVQIMVPTGTVGLTTPVEGTVTGFAHDDLWLDIQSTAEERHHPTDYPCTRSGQTFSFDMLHVGRPIDAGITFHLTVLAARRGSTAEKALQAYAARSKNGPDAYLGLLVLPAGVETVDTIDILRR